MGKIMTGIKTLKKLLLIVPIACLLAACAKRTGHPQLSADVGFINPKNLPVSAKGVNPMRLKALQESALALGAKGALAWRATRINAFLEAQKNSLDNIYDFNQLLLRHNVLPPVLVEANNDIDLTNDDTIRLANKVYKILKPARFVTAPPTWRTYLWLGFKKPDLPDEGTLPTTQKEADVWNSYLKKGWKQGLTQANSIFYDDLSRLKQNYAGMVLYNKMVTEHMISAPTVAKAQMGITGNSREIRVNDVIMRITGHSTLQTNANKWQPFLTTHN
jgi:defect in organelle trafficking protein DotC